MVNAALYLENQLELFEKCGPLHVVNTQGSSFGKTSQERSAQIKGMILEPCLKKSQKPKFQCLQVEDGQQQEWLEGTELKSLGESWMPNIGECPSVERESFLSQILEDNVPAKYYLSQKACQGILRRAAARGKELPEILRIVLEKQSCLNREAKTECQESMMKFAQRSTQHRGGQRQPCIAQAVGFKANASIADNAPVINEAVPTMQTTSQLAVCYGADLSQKAEGICWKEEVAACLTNGTHAGHGCHVVRMRSGCEGGEKGALVSKECALTLATNNDMTVFQPIPINDKATRYKGGGDTRNNDGAGNGLGVGKAGDPMHTLTSCDRHAVAYPSTDYSGFINSEVAATLKACGGCLGGGSENLAVAIDYIVRRLTPTECERLQGLPDGYTALGSDTARYKALGNGMAQPCADFVMQGIAKICGLIEKGEGKRG